MEERDTLLTFAEIAVALAGFTGLVSVMGRGERSRTVDRFRLRMMLEVALRNAAFALLPIPFLDVVSSDTMLWRIASGIYLVAVPAHMLFRRQQSSAGGFDAAMSAASLSLLPLSLLACLANVFGLGGAHAFSLYLLSLLLGLVTAGMLFVSVVGAIFEDE